MPSRPRTALSLAAVAALGTGAVVLAVPAHAVSSDVVLSEVYGGGGNSGATLTNDFVELFNAGSAAVDVTGWSVQYASSAGTTWQVTPLTGIVPPGVSYLVQEAAGAGGTTTLPTPDAVGSIALSATNGKVALVTTTAPLACGADCDMAPGVRDFLGYGSANDFEGHAGPALSNTTSAARTAAGFDTDDNAADFTAGTPTPCGTDGCDVEPPPGIEDLLIHDIQGAGHTSPYDGERVLDVPGVVTAIGSNRFYYQDPTPDVDPATSEGTVVFGTPPPGLAVGDAVLVTGTVDEFGFSGELTTTELTGPTVTEVGAGTVAPTLIGPGGRTPPTTVIDDDSFAVFDPASDGIDFYESLEGMLVEVDDAQVVGPTNTFGELPIVTGPDAGPRTNRGGIVIQPGDFNPERVILDDGLVGAGGMPLANVGDTLPGRILGVEDYSFGNFKLLVTAPPALGSGGLQREVTTAPGRNRLAVATMNVENLAATSDPAKFAQLAAIVVDNLLSPDVVAVEEFQDNTGPIDDGVTDASATFATFIAAITAAGGPAYDYRQIDPLNDQDGGQPGGNIRVGFLFRTDRGLRFVDRPGGDSTTPVGVVDNGGRPQLTISPGRIQPGDPAWSSSRKPLAAEFTYQGQTVFLVANHFNSKGGDDPLFGATQPPVRDSEVQRAQQAELVRSLVDDILAIDSNAQVAVLGDLNDFQFSGTMQILESTGSLRNLMSTLPVTEQYGYVFDGNSQALDHTLLSPALFTGRRGTARFSYDSVHVNAEFADQASDHDPQVTLLDFTGRSPGESLGDFVRRVLTRHPAPAAGLRPV